MNDTYVEVMVARKKNPLAGIGRIACYVLATLFFLLGILTGRGLMVMIAAAFAAVAYFVFPGFDIEYEYLYVDRELSIDKIMSKEKRRNVYTVELDKMEFIAPANSHELDSYKARNLKVYDFTSGKDGARVYSIVYETGREGTVLVNFEPNEEMLRAIKNVFPRKVLEI